MVVYKIEKAIVLKLLQTYWDLELNVRFDIMLLINLETNHSIDNF
jgi:hypothetical protein